MKKNTKITVGVLAITAVGIGIYAIANREPSTEKKRLFLLDWHKSSTSEMEVISKAPADEIDYMYDLAKAFQESREKGVLFIQNNKQLHEIISDKYGWDI